MIRACQRPDRALGGVVADLQASVVEIARQRTPARAGIADRSGQFALAGDHRERSIEERGKIVDHGTRRLWRMCTRCCGDRPMAARSMSNSWPIRSSASPAIGALVAA